MEKTAYHRLNQSNEQSDEVTQKDAVVLKRFLGIIPSISFILGLIIGTGIFLTPAAVLRGSSGSIGISFIIWIVAALISATGAMCVTELAVYFRQSGGAFVFLNEVYGPAAAFVNTFITLFVIHPCSSAIQSIVIVDFLLTSFAGSCDAVPSIGIKFGATTVFMLAVFINSISSNWTSRTQVFLTFIKVGAVVLVILMGAITMIIHGADHLREPFHFTDSFQWSRLPSGFFSASFAYGGWYNIANITEEVKQPQKTIVRAMVISMVCTTILYLLANLAYMVVLSPGEIMASDAVAALFAVRVVGVRWSFIIWVCVVLSACGNLNGSTYATSRIFFVAARANKFPFILSTIHIKRKTPMAAILATFPFTIIAIWAADVWTIINFTVCLAISFSTLIIFTVPYLRWKLPNRELAYKSPIWSCIVFLGFNTTLLLVTAYTNPIQIGVGAATVCIALLSYGIFELTGKSDRAVTMMRSSNEFLQKMLFSVQQEIDTY